MSLALALGVSGASAQTQDDFFNNNVLQEIRLYVNPADLQRLRSNFRDNTYYPCDFVWRGVTVENVGIRSAGAGSRSPIKPNLRVDFNRFEANQQFLGLHSVKLDANTQDPTQIRERITVLLFQRMGLPAPRETHARLFLNDQYAGLYAVVENVDKRFLRRNFGEDDGYLYEYKYAFPFKFEYLGPDLARYSPVPFQPETHENSPDPRSLEALVRTVNQVSDAEFPSAVAEYLDLPLFLTHVALETFMAEVDGVLGDLGMANFYFYRFERKNTHQFIVWDKDNTFSRVNRPIFQNTTDNVLMRRALAAPSNRNFYLEILVRAAELAGGPGGWLDQEIERVYGQIRAAAREDPNKQCTVNDFQPGTPLRPCTNEDFEAGIQHLRQFARGRSVFVLGEAFAAGYRPSGAAPRLSQGGAVNAASSQPFLTPGSLASIYGEGLATTTAQAGTLPIPTTLGGVSMTIGGVPAPILFASPLQVNLQVPWEVAPGSVSISATLNGVPGNTITAEVRSAAPGIFVPLHADGSLITADKPAGASDVLVIYATGLGPVTVEVATGRPAPSSPLAETTARPAVTIGGVPAQILFSGLTPGFVGLYQINIQLPAGTPAGASTPLIVTASGQASPAVAIATR